MLKAEATKELYSFNHLIEGIASMASGVKFSFFIALFIVLVAVGAAHEGHDHMAPAEPPSNHTRSINYININYYYTNYKHIVQTVDKNNDK